MLAATIIPVMDRVIVPTHHGPKATAHGVHRGNGRTDPCGRWPPAGVTGLTTARPMTRCS